MNFGRNADVQRRLHLDLMAFCFMSFTDFNDSESEYLLNFPTLSGLSCKDYRGALIESIIGPESHYATMCTSHDLATTFAKIYGIRKECSKDERFKSILKHFGKNSKSVDKP